jgi:hypothetical protein
MPVARKKPIRVKPEGGDALHSLRNTLGAIQIRLTMVCADPTCRWAQEENLGAITRLLGDAMAITREMAGGGPPAKRRAKR